MAMIVYVLESKTDSHGTIVEGAYSTKEKAQKALEDFLRRNFYDGFPEFCSEDEDWDGEINPFLAPTDGENLEEVLSAMYYENDAAEWACITETELDA